MKTFEGVRLSESRAVSELPYVVLLLLVIGGFLYGFYDRFLPLGEGLFSVYYGLTKLGKVPYRDFYLFVPPLHVYIVGWYQELFGTEFIRLRFLGLSVMLTETVLLYFVYRFHFSRVVSFFATSASVVFYVTHAPYIFHDYNDFINLFLVLLMLLLHFYTRKENLFVLFLGGFVNGLVLVEKQSLGPLLFVAIVFYIGYFFKGSWRKIIYYCAGAFIPVLVLLVYLWLNGAVPAFWDNVFMNVGQKGSFWEVVTRAFFVSIQKRVIVIMFFLCFVWFFTKRFWYSFDGGLDRRGVLGSPGIELAYAVGISLTLAMTFFFWHVLYQCVDTKLFHDVFKRFPNVVFLLALFVLFQDIFRREASSALNAAYLVPACAFTVASVMSAGAYIPIHPTFLVDGFMIGYFLERCNVYAKSITIFLFAFIMMIMMSYKYYSPYGIGLDARWWATGFQVPVDETNYEPKAPLLKGLHSGNRLGYAVDEISSYLTSHHVKSGELLAYPLNSLFYMTTGTLPVKLYSPTFWYDISNPRHMAKDVDLIVASPPKYVVWTKYGGYEDVSAHEWAYAKGKRFEYHRRLIDMFEHQYVPVYSFRVEDNMSLLLLVKK